MRLHATYRNFQGKSLSLAQLLCRPENSYRTLLELFPDCVHNFGEEVHLQIELNCKYAGYLERQEKDVLRLESLENHPLPLEFDYSLLKGLRNEAREKLSRFTPHTVGQASRISGVSPADISVLLVALK